MARISELEKKNALTTFENSAIIKLLTDWANQHGLKFDTTYKETQTSEEGKETQTEKPIEFPINNFFENYVKKDKVLTTDNYKEFIYIFKEGFLTNTILKSY